MPFLLAMNHETDAFFFVKHDQYPPLPPWLIAPITKEQTNKTEKTKPKRKSAIPWSCQEVCSECRRQRTVPLPAQKGCQIVSCKCTALNQHTYLWKPKPEDDQLKKNSSHNLKTSNKLCISKHEHWQGAYCWYVLYVKTSEGPLGKKNSLWPELPKSVCVCVCVCVFLGGGGGGEVELRPPHPLLLHEVPELKHPFALGAQQAKEQFILYVLQKETFRFAWLRPFAIWPQCFKDVGKALFTSLQSSIRRFFCFWSKPVRLANTKLTQPNGLTMMLTL